MTRWSHDVPRWPSGLRDDTPLPYAAWRVLDLVDGKRTLAQIAAHLDLAQEDVERALEQAQSWLGRALRREQPVTEAVLDNVTQALVSVVGPIGEFLIDDALDQVGEGATLSALLGAVAPELDEAHLHQFVRQLRTRRLA
ncbi:hypothetical protein [Deinococcus radiodurans]|uniref:DUF8082 domain-containing protein n=1 Tax=Deinococcus radiodurans (strain ATCC 13939 / DSM 20539 / JCM 16871 / CCUG 27074 / LMG 4051 / NBRC 15346 / NCIMB 9279 / VKM B-1422 / R1) TaxID=243230 RepID=Q9RTD5_DEIRA|nr:hypothetical protein [Deinococcus radiodurans]AAF11386.1 hypothetical protein DR_1830 [Deinococcus radiodurans R1 = ATCC 13939 = DSM 20539]ANC71076.1 hypothetical protein A2G07_04450 [Deinococcus radiodurans R1 = ATCC 13939 = DSM 20539]QEM71244.1 hypothetical protein DXG80_05355 [Deinococcus radiodurans]QIP29786.1 hypothetical protein HAV23_12045 [Deinococcus radiodurans]QIP31535.1 hypothetical protein HAV35_04745 [Deinococcus radiodurans]